MVSGLEARDIREVAPIWRQWNLIRNFGQRDLKTKFKGSALGWAWSLVVPVATLAIYTMVFQIIFRGEPPQMGNGNAGIFVLWLFCGLIMWTFFSSTVNSGISGLLSSGGLLQKIYFPAYAPVLGASLAVGVQSIIELSILAVVLVALGNVGWTWLAAVPMMGLFVVFTVSFAVLVAILNIYMRDLAHLVAIFLQLLFYMTPIIYPLSFVQDKEWHGIKMADVIMLNPLAHFVELFHDLVYGLQWGNLSSWITLTIWTTAMFALAAVVYKHKGRDLGEQI